VRDLDGQGHGRSTINGSGPSTSALGLLLEFSAGYGASALDATGKDVEIGGAGLAAQSIELGLVDELGMFRYPVVVGGGTPFLPPVADTVPLHLVETRTFGSEVIYERYRRVLTTRNDSPTGELPGSAGVCRKRIP
jgi:hypothetical protein